MATATDPARELGEIAERLTIASNQHGAPLLANQFGVEVWSTDFMKIIACIMDRADLVARIVRHSDLDEDHKEKALDHLAKFKAGFTGTALVKDWNTADCGLSAMKDHGSPIQFLSQTVRPHVRYPKLSQDEVSELIGLIDAYLADIAVSDEGPDFVRQAITEGLTAFRFQLEKLGWMGSGYALAAFREVVSVYEMSRREYQGAGELDAEAFLRGFFGIISNFKSKVDAAKGWKESAEAVWNVYKIANTVATPLLLSGHFPALPSS